MTSVGPRFRVLLLVVVLVGAVAAPAVATDEHRSEPAETDPPVRVYVSETLNVSSVELTGGGTVGTAETTLVPVAGGPSFTVDPTSADFDGREPGAYYVERDSDVRADILVVSPRVTGLVLRDDQQMDVTGSATDPGDLSELSVRARYNFDAVDRLDVTVTGPTDSTVATGRITTNNGRAILPIEDPTPGVYTVTVTGSGVEAGTASATVRVRGATATPTRTVTATPTPTPAPTATPTPTATATATPTPVPATSTATTTAPPTETASNGPGFGVGVALLALLGVVPLVRSG